MVNSRSLDDLHPRVAAMARAWLARCQAAGLDILVTSTWRDHASQAALYAQGRTTPGRRVTNARPGQSWHNWRCALDFVPMRAGKPVWGYSAPADAALWRCAIDLALACGLESLERSSFPEKAHLQYRGGLSLADFQAGRTLPA